MASIHKGEFLQIGLSGRKWETKKEMIIGYFTYIGGVVLMFVLAGLAATGHGYVAGSQLLGVIIPLLIGVIILCITLFVGGAEINAVYEDGLTHWNVGLIKKLQGKHWIPWEEIDRVEYGYIDIANNRKLEPSEYVRIYAEDKATWYYAKKKYNPHNPKFYPLLLKMIHEHSPDIDWVRKDITRFEEYESKDLPIPSPSCPHCGGALSFIPDYERWYCYECGEYDMNDE